MQKLSQAPGNNFSVGVHIFFKMDSAAFESFWKELK
jgi:hypothetical protein